METQARPLWLRDSRYFPAFSSASPPPYLLHLPSPQRKFPQRAHVLLATCTTILLVLGRQQLKMDTLLTSFPNSDLPHLTPTQEEAHFWWESSIQLFLKMLGHMPGSFPGRKVSTIWPSWERGRGGAGLGLHIWAGAGLEQDRRQGSVLQVSLCFIPQTGNIVVTRWPFLWDLEVIWFGSTLRNFFYLALGWVIHWFIHWLNKYLLTDYWPHVSLPSGYHSECDRQDCN